MSAWCWFVLPMKGTFQVSVVAWESSGYHLMVCHFQRILGHFRRIYFYPRKAETHHHHWQRTWFGWTHSESDKDWLEQRDWEDMDSWLFPFFKAALVIFYFPVWTENSTESMKVSASVAFEPRDGEDMEFWLFPFCQVALVFFFFSVWGENST